MLEQFSLIVRLSSNDLNNLENYSFIRNREGVVSNARSLVIVELVRDIDDATWRRFHSFICCRNSGNNKVILISRMEVVSSLGTTPALRLKKLRCDEYWYFFKTLSFGSANPEEHEELASLAWKIATQIKGTFIAANVFARLLRANPNVQFWRHILEFVRKAVQWNRLVCAEDAWDPVSKNHHYYLSDHVNGPLVLCNNGYKTAVCLVKRTAENNGR